MGETGSEQFACAGTSCLKYCALWSEAVNAEFIGTGDYDEGKADEVARRHCEDHAAKKGYLFGCPLEEPSTHRLENSNQATHHVASLVATDSGEQTQLRAETENM